MRFGNDDKQMMKYVAQFANELHEALITVSAPGHLPRDADNPVRAWLDKCPSIVASTALYSYWQSLCTAVGEPGRMGERWRREARKAVRDSLHRQGALVTELELDARRHPRRPPDTQERPPWMRLVRDAEPHDFSEDPTMSPDEFNSAMTKAAEQLYDLAVADRRLNDWFEAYPPSVIEAAVWAVVRCADIYSTNMDGPCDILAEEIAKYRDQLGVEKADELEQKVADVREALAVIVARRSP